MPLYEYECTQRAIASKFNPEGHERPLSSSAKYAPRRRQAGDLRSPPLLHNRGVHVFDRVTGDDVLARRPSSLKSLKKDKF